MSWAASAGVRQRHLPAIPGKSGKPGQGPGVIGKAARIERIATGEIDGASNDDGRRACLLHMVDGYRALVV